MKSDREFVEQFGVTDPDGNPEVIRIFQETTSGKSNKVLETASGDPVSELGGGKYRNDTTKTIFTAVEPDTR